MACSEGRRPLGAVLHSSNEPSELSQWPCGHDDSTINIVMGIIIIIIIINKYLLVLDNDTTQPSTLRGTVNEYQLSGWVIIINGDGGGSR